MRLRAVWRLLTTGCALAALPVELAADSVDDITQEIQRLYREHNPSKLGTVPRLLEKYHGQEAELLASIREKYGVDPADPPPSPTPPQSNEDDTGLPELGGGTVYASPQTGGGGGGGWSGAQASHCLAPQRPNPHHQPDRAPVAIPWPQAKRMSQRDFFEKMQHFEPVHLPGACSTIPAAGWTMDNVAPRMGQKMIEVEVSKPGESFKYGESGTTRQRMTFARFQALSADPNVQAYWANDIVPPELADDVREPNFLGHIAPASKTLLWWGAGGQVTKAHYDSFDNMICVLKGTKDFLLYPPWETHLISPYTTAGLSYINIDLESPFANETHDPAAAARFRRAARYVANVGKGDCLWIPAYWHHEVLSSEAEETLAFSLWYPNMLVSARALKQWVMMDDQHESNSLTTCIGGRFKARLVKQFFGPGGNFNTELKDEWRAWVAADADRDAAVGKEELEAVRGAGGEEGEVAGEMMKLWEAMLAGNWKVGKDRERRANASPSKYTIPASVMKKITHEQVGYPQKIKEPKARGQAKLDAMGFAVLWAKAQYGLMEQQLSTYRRTTAGLSDVEFRAGSLSTNIPKELSSRPNGAGATWETFARLIDELMTTAAQGDLTAIKAALNAKLPSFPMRNELLQTPPEQRPALVLGGCEDTVEARAKGDSCTMLMRIAYRWLMSAYRLVD